MKVLIWLLSALAYGIITALLNAKGIMLGAIPTWVLVGVILFVANTLCQIYDDHKKKDGDKGKNDGQ